MVPTPFKALKPALSVDALACYNSVMVMWSVLPNSEAGMKAVPLVTSRAVHVKLSELHTAKGKQCVRQP